MIIYLVYLWAQTIALPPGPCEDTATPNHWSSLTLQMIKLIMVTMITMTMIMIIKIMMTMIMMTMLKVMMVPHQSWEGWCHRAQYQAGLSSSLVLGSGGTGTISQPW